MIKRFHLGLLLSALAAQVSHAEDCMVCDAEIVMTPTYAECFLLQVDAVINDMHRQQLSYQLVNLGACEGINGAERGSDGVADSAREVFGLADIRNSTPNTPTEPTATFILDETGLRCLADHIRADRASFDPAAAFRPSEMCGQ